MTAHNDVHVRNHTVAIDVERKRQINDSLFIWRLH